MTRSLRPFALSLLLLSLDAAATLAQCTAGRWVTLAPMNDPRQELAAAQLGGKIYAVAGLAGSATANEIYDPASDHWSFGADFPTPTDHAWAVAFEGLLYVGRNEQSSFLLRSGDRRLDRDCLPRLTSMEERLRRPSWTAGSSWPEEPGRGPP